ncbi:MAG: inverse autotransporter beta domain-containing protein, partial [Planctomycetaceae bacterium]
MKPTRILASATLIVSSLALITAAGISVGDEPGVVRMGSNPTQAGSATTPVPDPMNAGVATLDGGPPEPYMGMYPQPAPYAPYFERSSGATQQLPHSAYQPVQPFGPIIMFETNINNGLGYEDSYQRLNARVPYHIVPNTNVLISDISASVTNNGDPLANVGLIYRNYDPSLNRIFGWNAYGDYDQGNGTGDWYQVGAGFESLGKYLDFRVNGYQVVGDDSTLLSSNLSNTLRLMGNGAFKVRNQVLDNAYSGIQAEVGGPLPILGQYGLNMYMGGYYLHNENGYDAPGFAARWEALVTESLRVNTYLTTDDTFGTNSWVSLQYDLPNYKNRRVFRPSSVRDRLQDPVVRDNRIHVNRDARALNEAVINTSTGLAYNILNVNPNATTAGNGTFETPYSTLQAAAIANNAGVDIIRVVPRADDSTTNLTVNGGISLFDDQTLLSSLKPLILGPECIIGADTGLPTALGPLISNPTMVAGGSVVRLRNNDAVIGMRIDASNEAGTVFGNGIVNPLPITDANLTCNIFTNYTNGAFLQDVSGRIIIDQNEFNGLAGTSVNGLNMTVAGGATVELLVRDNIASNNSGTGLSIIANPGSTINADDPNGT